MAKLEWGTKRICQSCAMKFYDMRRSPITCPSCGAVFDPESILRSRRARPAPVKEKVPERGKVEPEEEIEEEEETLEDSGEELIEDASDLGGDDDLGEVEVEEDEKGA